MHHPAALFAHALDGSVFDGNRVAVDGICRDGKARDSQEICASVVGSTEDEGICVSDGARDAFIRIVRCASTRDPTLTSNICRRAHVDSIKLGTAASVEELSLSIEVAGRSTERVGRCLCGGSDRLDRLVICKEEVLSVECGHIGDFRSRGSANVCKFQDEVGRS